jgi:hypothetical protein
MHDDPAQPDNVPAENPGVPPALEMRQLLNGYRVTQILSVAARLGLADLLAEGPRTADELASATGMHAGALYRILRALASVGVFAETATPRQFTLTPLAAVLRTDHPQSQRDHAIFVGEEPYRAWADLLYSAQTEAPAFEHVFGTGHFAYLAQHPAASAIFDGFMSAGSRQSASAVAEAYDFTAAGTVVDVGGGQGRLIATILHAYPSLRGILFDQPHVVAGAGPVLAEAGVADRCERMGGDFLSDVPRGGGIYVLRRILHDWDDDRAVAILRNCARAMDPGARVLVAEMIIPPGNEPSWAKFRDLQMLVMLGGRERTAEEYRGLFAAAGLSLTRLIPAGPEESLIEGERASA